jgi:uncharacterized protein (TIGR02217 family)
MSSYLYPSIGIFVGATQVPSAYTPGCTLAVIRAPEFNTGITKAISGKESRIAYQAYPLMTWTLQYEFLRDFTSPSEFKALFSLYMALYGRYDTCLFTDPWFNTVTTQQFATTGTSDTAGTPYQITATYTDTAGYYAGVGAPELIQNFNGAPSIYGNGTLISSSNYSVSGTGVLTFNSGNQPASGTVLTWSGAFYYRVRFDDDNLEFDQFMANFWEVKKVKLRQIKL